MVELSLESLKEEINELREIVYELQGDCDDGVLTPEEEIEVRQSLEEYRKGNTISGEELWGDLE